MNLTNFTPTPEPSDDNKPAQQFLKDDLFYPGDIDGDFGPQSQLALRAYLTAIDPSKDWMDLALVFLGVEEVPRDSNRGPFVELFQRIANGSPGDSWCAEFVSAILHWWFTFNPNANGRPVPPMQQAAWGFAGDWAEATGAQVYHPSETTPRRGDIIEYTFSHVGFNLEQVSDNVFNDIEGNTDLTGDPNGYAVCKHPRSRGVIKYIVRLPV